MVSTNLVVPVVLWGPTPPTHCVSSVFMSDDQTTLVTGCYDGQICIWNVDPGTLKMSPRCMLVGHSAPVICLVRASLLQENNFIVSSSENGEMCTWDLVDGKCTEAVKLPQIHTQIQSYQPANSEDLRLFCIGYYPEIVVMDPFSLEIIYMLSSKVKPDWISALHVLRPMRRKDDVVLAITTTGTVKVWTLVGNENKNAEPIYENESKEIRCLNAITMNCCVQNQRTVLIVCTKYWQIFDAGDFTVLCSVIAPSRERWQGGDFISSDRVLLWTDEGKGYLYKLPANCIPDNKEFHSKSMVRDAPYLYYVLQQPGDKILSCPPAMQLVRCQQNLKQSYLLRGDSEGYNSIWTVPDVPLDNISILQAKQMSPRFLKPTICTSLLEAWSMMDPPPVGILDQLSRITDSPVKLTSSIYLPQQSRLVIGREDGTIVIVPATQTVMMQLLAGIQQNFTEWPSHQILYGHRGRVNCLLCPSLMHARYDKSLLLSGGVDFAVCVWDLYSGSLLHRFCVHAGEITQLLVPPETCSPRILKCICSVASDHSVTLLSVQERKCVTLASRHLFPVVTIKWRPLDDFLIVGCSDGSVYVWQMETGHLDRVLHGMLAEEVLMACDEQSSDSLTNGNSTTAADIGSEMGMANPAVHFFRGLKSRNMNAIRHATQRGLHQLQQLHGHNQGNLDFLMKHRNNPLLIQGLRTNPKDAECHILFFDIEGLIFELHSEEYAQMTPEALEALGIMISNPKDKTTTLDASKKISDFFGKVKNKAGDMEKILKDKDRHGLVQKFKEKTEIMEKKVQAKVDSLQKAVDTPERKSDMKSKIDSKMEVTHVMEVAQLLLSLLHSWGLDPHLDKVCESQLGLLRPLVPISFGVLSKAGYMSLLLPTWQNNCTIPDDIEANSSNALKKRDFPPEILRQEQLTKMFTSRLHWELSPTLTSNHILALVAMSNTLMSMSSASFLTESEKTKKLMRLAQRSESTLNSEDEREELIAHHTSQIKQGWSLLSTHHCFLLPDKIEALEPRKFKRPQVEMMAKRWQHHCIEVREAAQQILLGELSRMGKKGRKQLVEHWAQYLPLYTHTEPIATQQVQHTMAANTTNNSSSQNNNSNNNGNHGSGNGNLNVANVVGGGNTNSTTSSSIASGINQENQDDDFDEEEEGFIRKPSSLSELKRKQTTAVILLGVIGAEFGQDISAQESPCTRISLTERRRSSGVEGFGIANNLARLTSMALAHLLYAPSSAKLPQFTPLRRAAIDLLGRGFTVWEPYLDVSKVLLGLLEISCEGKNVPNLNYKLPLTPQADACRTARHALRLIATARPAAFITTMAREVARYNTMQQNAQSVNVTVTQSVLFKAKSEILQCVEMLIDKMQAEIAGLLVEVMDITLHCLDSNELKNHSMAEVFPPMCKFNQISHCAQTRRIAVGASNGHLAIYELRQNKCQMIPAHSHPISSLAFSPDGKYLVSYSCKENRLSFWQTSTGMFGLGQSQTRCTKGYSTAPIPDVSRFNPMRLAKLVWINNRTVTLMLADGSETRFNV